LGISIAADDLLGEIMTVPLARIGALLPLLMMVLILLFRPRGLMGTRDT
jgi:branched-chain amino acid transport system permease protein